MKLYVIVDDSRTYRHHSNALAVFSVYGDHVLAWDTSTGELVVEYQLPPTHNETSKPPPDYFLPEPRPLPMTPGEDVGDEGTTAEGRGGTADGEEPPTRQRRNSMMHYGPQKANIRSMMLRGTKLIVVASGYGFEHQQSKAHVIDSYLGTRVMIFETKNVGNSTAFAFEETGGLELLMYKDVSGNFVSARSIGDSVHLVTDASINYYERLVGPFEKFNDIELSEMSEEDYVSTVKMRAQSKVIPEFASTFIEDVRVDGELPFFFRLSNWMDDVTGRSVAAQAYPEGYLRGVALVYSFDVTEAPTGDLTFSTVKASGAILPSAYGTKVYASQDTMIIATPGMGYSEKRRAVVQKTYLMSLKLSGAASSPYTVGSVLGNILNQFSLDVHDGVLRMATTLRNFWRWGVRPLEEDLVETTEDNEGPPESIEPPPPEPPVQVWEESTTENYVMTLSLDGEDHDNNSTTPFVMQQLDELYVCSGAIRFLGPVKCRLTSSRVCSLDILQEDWKTQRGDHGCSLLQQVRLCRHVRTKRSFLQTRDSLGWFHCEVGRN